MLPPHDVADAEQGIAIRTTRERRHQPIDRHGLTVIGMHAAPNPDYQAKNAQSQR